MAVQEEGTLRGTMGKMPDSIHVVGTPHPVETEE
jgi:hypothetical protein